MMHKSRGEAGWGRISGLLSLVFSLPRRLKKGKFLFKKKKRQSSSYLPLKDWESLCLIPFRNFFRPRLVHMFVNSVNVHSLPLPGELWRTRSTWLWNLFVSSVRAPSQGGVWRQAAGLLWQAFLAGASLSAFSTELPDQQWSELLWHPRSLHTATWFNSAQFFCWYFVTSVTAGWWYVSWWWFSAPPKTFYISCTILGEKKKKWFCVK